MSSHGPQRWAARRKYVELVGKESDANAGVRSKGLAAMIAEMAVRKADEFVKNGKASPRGSRSTASS